jgi:hypothetical protein
MRASQGLAGPPLPVQAIPGVTPLPPNTNPASWMLDVLYKTKAPEGADASASTAAAAAPPADEHNHDTPPRFAVLYKASANAQASSKDVLALSDPSAFNGSAQKGSSSLYGANVFVQAAYIGLRHWRETLRLPDFTMIRFFVTIFLALFFGLIWFDSVRTPSDESGAYTALGVYISPGVFLSIVTFATVAPVYAGQRAVFYREKAASYYTPEAYALTLLWVELPWLALQSLVFNVSGGWMEVAEARIPPDANPLPRHPTNPPPLASLPGDLLPDGRIQLGRRTLLCNVPRRVHGHDQLPL